MPRRRTSDNLVTQKIWALNIIQLSSHLRTKSDLLVISSGITQLSVGQQVANNSQMRFFGSNRLTHFNRHPGLQTILLGELLSEPPSKGRKGSDIGTSQIWSTSNHLKTLLEVEIGDGPTDELLKRGEPEIV